MFMKAAGEFVSVKDHAFAMFLP